MWTKLGSLALSALFFCVAIREDADVVGLSTRFEVLGRLGAGGMGVVYEVLDRQRQARMALKTLHVTEAGAIVRLKREFRALQDVQHPNLVMLGELLEHEGRWAFTMELVPGVDFLTYVRPERSVAVVSESFMFGRTVQCSEELSTSDRVPPGYRPAPLEPEDLDRLRRASAQLAAGLAALHEAGLVHRDVKPGNVRVTPDGRVVLLDFGLAAQTHRSDVGGNADERVVGTVAYMAPEQAAGQRVGAAADWYSFGVMLYEALTGRLPFSGAAIEQLSSKQRMDPSPPSRIEPTVPPDLDELCAKLLRRAPEARLSGGEVLARLGASLPVPRATSAGQSGLGNDEPPFLGREAELAVLGEAFSELQAGHAVSVVIGGRSGVGKSALVERALFQARASVSELTILAGRCHERESVPYKAFDGIADALAKHLLTLEPAEVRSLLPAGGEVLAQVFPQLTAVRELARSAQAAPRAVDPLEQRRELFAALRELLSALAARAPVCLSIDDLQWADADSLALLSVLLAPPGAPPVLLLATLRDDSPEAAHIELPGDVRQLEVLPLPQEEAQALAERLLELAGAPVDTAGQIAREAMGHPLFIDELVRRASRGDVGGEGIVRLDDALWERAAGLDEGTRALLELSVLAGGRLRQSTAQRAAGTEAAVFLRQLGELRAARFCRTSGGRGEDIIEPWHDRVRESLAARLSQQRIAAGHELLARALEGEDSPDPEALARHFGAAGQPERAANYAVQAARRASGALAFGHAARLYRKALELGAPPGVGVGSIHAALGEALAASGRGAEAAEAYLEAARGADPADNIELRRRAAEVRLKVGDFEAGLELLRGVLRPFGMGLPRTPRRALWSLVVARMRLALRGMRIRKRDLTKLPARQLVRADLCWSAAIGLALSDFIIGADFQTRHLRMALGMGEPYRVARALCAEAAFLSARGERARRQVTGLLERAREFASQVDSPHAVGFANVTRGLCAFNMGDFRGALESWPASDWLRAHCTGVEWEAAIAHVYSATALNYMGKHRELARRFPPVLAESERRGDRFADTTMRVTVYQSWLVNDDPDGSDRQIERALAIWTRPGFYLQHYLALLASGQIALYRGGAGPDSALARVEAGWTALRRSLLLRIAFTRWSMLDLRARSRLALARTLPDGDDKRRALAEAERFVKRLGRAPEAYARGMAMAVLASVAAQRGEQGTAVARYEAAAEVFAGREMRGYVAAMHFRAAQLDDNAARADAGDQALAFATEEGIVAPARFFGMLAP